MLQLTWFHAENVFNCQYYLDLTGQALNLRRRGSSGEITESRSAIMFSIFFQLTFKPHVFIWVTIWRSAALWPWVIHNPIQLFKVEPLFFTVSRLMLSCWCWGCWAPGTWSTDGLFSLHWFLVSWLPLLPFSFSLSVLTLLPFSLLLSLYPAGHQQDEHSPAQAFLLLKGTFFLPLFRGQLWVSVKH